MDILVLLNNFLHDFSAAGWLFGAVIIWSILRKQTTGFENAAVISSVLRTVLLLMRFSLAGIIIFGLVRAIAYKGYEWNEASGQGQVTLILLKHVVLTVVFAAGLVYYIKAGKFVKKV